MVHQPNQVRVGVRELRNKLGHYLTVTNQGTKIIVTARNVVIAEIHAPSSRNLQPRIPGALRGQIWMADDFDVLPQDILDAMEG